MTHSTTLRPILILSLALGASASFAQPTSAPTPRINALRVHPLAPEMSAGPEEVVASGLLYRFQIEATNSPTSYSAEGLPAGLTLNPQTGEIVGVCGYNGGTYSATVSATNRHGTTTTQQVFTVNGIGPIEMPYVRGIAPPPDGIYRVGDTLVFCIQFVRGYTFPLVTGKPRLAFTIGGHTRYATYDNGSGEEMQFYVYAVTAEDPSASGIVTSDTIDLNGGTIRDAASLWSALNLTPIRAPGVQIEGGATAATRPTPRNQR